jgi:hypothetical protein
MGGLKQELNIKKHPAFACKFVKKWSKEMWQ